jgi:Flp pilus assembly protein TadG
MRLHPTRTRGRVGAAVVELAACLPFIIYIAVIGTDWARLFYYTIAIKNCARSGALWAADPTTQGESPYTTVTQAAQGAAPTLKPTPTVTSTATTLDGRTGVSVTVSVQFTTLTKFPGVPHSQTLTRTVSMQTIPATPD